MENQEIKYMLALQKYANITKAAQSLYISQSALSRFLIGKEKEVGGTLFSREKSRLVPTELGLLYLKYAKEIAEKEQECNDAIKAWLFNEKTRIIFGIPTSRVERLSGLVLSLVQMNPQFRIEIRTGTSLEIQAMAQRAELDAAVVNSFEPQEQSVPLLREEILLSVPRSIQKKLGIEKDGDSAEEPLPVLQLARLTNEKVMISSEDHMLGRLARRIMDAENFHPEKIQTINNSWLVLQLSEKEDAVSFTFHPGDFSGIIVNRANLFRMEHSYYNYVDLVFLTRKARQLRWRV